MTSERLAEIEQHKIHVGIGPLDVLPTTQESCILCELLTTLREAQEEIVAGNHGANILQMWYEQCQKERDALQRRVEALEKALCSRGYHIPTEHPRMWWQGNYYVMEGGTERGPCDFCEAALRGEEVG